MGLRSGEELVRSAGGVCCVCRGRIDPGPAVQSCESSEIRHPECLPEPAIPAKARKTKYFVNRAVVRRPSRKYLSE